MILSLQDIEGLLKYQGELISRFVPDESFSRYHQHQIDMRRAVESLIDVMKERDAMRETLKEAGDVIESYHKTTGIDLGDMGRMPFYDDTIMKIDGFLKPKDQHNDG